VKEDRDINIRILEVRKALGLSQKRFADGIKVSRQYQGFLEQKGQKVNGRIISIICMTYGVNEEWLRTDGGEMFEKKKDLRLERALREFQKLDVFLQDCVLNQIDLLLEYQERKGKDIS
jgi:transcriptional regulator with XRE-family HTH domain